MSGSTLITSTPTSKHISPQAAGEAPLVSHLRPPVWATSGEVKRSREAANIIVIQKEANGGMTGHAFDHFECPLRRSLSRWQR